ncbi:hypothetical protein Gasu2_00730 [Galdieria sulphuraria]|nr:hypothetical protein Gasu2_00730 [Galdieria sulphuraria]
MNKYSGALATITILLLVEFLLAAELSGEIQPDNKVTSSPPTNILETKRNLLPNETNPQCPSDYFLDTESLQCTNECSQDMFISAKHALKLVKKKSPPDSYITADRNCVTSCPTSQPYVDIVQDYKICRSTCPSWKPFKDGRLCVAQCNSYQWLDLENKECHYGCPKDKPLRDGRICRHQCPSYRVQDGENCLDSCPANKFLLNSTFCTSSCPQDMVYDGQVCRYHCHGKFRVTLNYQSPVCVETCPPSKPLLDGETCVDQCPTGKKQHNNTCVEFCPAEAPYNLNNQTCVSECPERLALSGFDCVDRCPNNTVLYNRACRTSCDFSEAPLIDDGKCASKCSSKRPYIVISGQPFIQTCVDQCPSYWPYVYQSICRSSCPDYTYRSGKLCLDACPSNSVIYGRECLDSCPKGTFISDQLYDGNANCVHACPSGRNNATHCIAMDKPKPSKTPQPSIEPATNNTNSSNCTIQDVAALINNVCLEKCFAGCAQNCSL